MKQKEIRKLTKERLSNIRVISAKLNKYKRKLEDSKKLEQDHNYIKELQ